MYLPTGSGLISVDKWIARGTGKVLGDFIMYHSPEGEGGRVGWGVSDSRQGTLERETVFQLHTAEEQELLAGDMGRVGGLVVFCILRLTEVVQL